MPKATTYTLAWSPTRQGYTLHDRQAELDFALDAGSPEWCEWLERTASFAFRGQRGAYTARREQIKPGDWYWYAYQRVGKRVRKQYLGKSEALSLLRFEEIAERFSNRPMNEGGAANGTMLTHLKIPKHEPMLGAKLHIPLPPQHLVPRPRLLTSLQGALAKPVTLLSAPAGSGKSTLVSSWLRQSSFPAAWLSLDQADNEVARFWSSLFTSLDTLYPGVGEHALYVLRSLFSPSIERVLTLFLNLLGDGTAMGGPGAGEALLALDDYHVISTEAIHQDMAFLLEHLPPHLHLVISTRNDPPLPLARWRVSDRLLELQASDLRFSRAESAMFLARQVGIDLSGEEITLLDEHTAGWAAGLQLVAIWLRDQQKRLNLLQSIKGSQPALREYLGQEILAQLSEPVQTFLLRTSILEQVEGRLCDAVSGQPGGEETLARLFQANLFLTPLDESHRWYRYHPVLLDMLRQHLQQNAARQIPELHRRASRWYREQRMLDEAIAHARLADDWEEIATIAEEDGVELISQGETQRVMNWVALLPRHVVFSRLRLFLFQCWWLWYSGHIEVVVEMMREYVQQHTLPDLEVEDVDTLERAIISHVDQLYPRSTWDEEQRANRIAEMQALYGVLTMQRPDGAAFSYAMCQRAVRHVAGLAHRARIGQHLGTVSILRGDLMTATAVLKDALASAIVDDSATWISSVGYRLGMLYEMLGQLHEVTYISQQILQLTTSKVFLTQGTAYTFLGRVEYERDHLEAAERYFKLAIATCEEADLLKASLPYMHFLLGHLHLAYLQYIRQDRTGARQHLEEITSYLSQTWVGDEVLPVVRGEYALLMHMLGDESAVRQWLEEFPPPEQGEQMLLRQFISLNPHHHFVFARALLAEQRWQEAEQLLCTQQMMAEQQGRIGDLLQWLTLLVRLYQAQGKTSQASSVLSRALSLAEPRGYLRLFLDAGAPVLTLLYSLRQELRARQAREEPVPTSSYLDRLILLLKQEQQARLSLGELLVEPLSEREREVLRHISEGHSNREIAERLIIAVSTVKSHVRAIYAKLGATSRTQALVQARRLKLL